MSQYFGGIPHDELLNTRSKFQTAYDPLGVLPEKGLLRSFRYIEVLSRGFVPGDVKSQPTH